MSGFQVCGCVIAALAELAPNPETEYGRYFVCRMHGQMVIWDNFRWRWSDDPADIAALPPMAEAEDTGAVQS